MKTSIQSNTVFFYNTQIDPDRLTNKVLKKIIKKSLNDCNHSYDEHYYSDYSDSGSRPWIK